jgi:hypothetical protein
LSLALTMEAARLGIVGSEYPGLASACKMTPPPTMEDAVAFAADEIGNECRVLVVSHALTTLPVIRPSAVLTSWQSGRRGSWAGGRAHRPDTAPDGLCRCVLRERQCKCAPTAHRPGVLTAPPHLRFGAGVRCGASVREPPEA